MSVTYDFPVYPGWKAVRLIGRGSFGAVYEIERDVFGDTEKAALKVLRIPQNESDIEELYNDGYDDASITSTFTEHLKSIVSEYSLMRKLNGHSNVVNCDDVSYVQHDDGIGWDIYIRMELLTPLGKALAKEPSEEQVIRIGADIARALVLCRRHNIIHRDIKPANIFVSDNGDYKLGDFGIAKTVERTSGGTKIGTYEYMAPEVYRGEPYGYSVDIYSLGMVLYWLLNDRRGPFLPPPPAMPTSSGKEAARARRFAGEALPAPAHGSEALKRLVLKAIAFDPKARFQTPEELLEALEALSAPARFSRAPKPAPVEPRPEPVEPVAAFASAAEPEQPPEEATVSMLHPAETEAPVPAEPAPAEPAPEADGEATVSLLHSARQLIAPEAEEPAPEAEEPAPAPKSAPAPAPTPKKPAPEPVAAPAKPGKESLSLLFGLLGFSLSNIATLLQFYSYIDLDVYAPAMGLLGAALLLLGVFFLPKEKKLLRILGFVGSGLVAAAWLQVIPSIWAHQYSGWFWTWYYTNAFLYAWVAGCALVLAALLLGRAAKKRDLFLTLGGCLLLIVAVILLDADLYMELVPLYAAASVLVWLGLLLALKPGRPGSILSLIGLGLLSVSVPLFDEWSPALCLLPAFAGSILVLLGALLARPWNKLRFVFAMVDAALMTFSVLLLIIGDTSVVLSVLLILIGSYLLLSFRLFTEAQGKLPFILGLAACALSVLSLIVSYRAYYYDLCILIGFIGVPFALAAHLLGLRKEG